MKRTFLVFAIAVAAGYVAWWAYGRIAPYATASPLALTIASGSGPPAALVDLAEGHGLFRKQGLVVHLKMHPTGKAAVAELVAGRADAALAAEFVLATQAGAHPELLALGSIARLQNIRLAALAERGIAGPEALEGLRVGLARGTQAEFFLGLTLLLAGANPERVAVVDLTPDQLVDALAAGRLDAVVLWDPYIQRLRTASGKRLVTWPLQGDRDYFWTLMTTKPVLARDEEAFKRFFRALNAAEVLAARNPGALLSVIEKTSGEAPPYATQVLPQVRYRVSAEQGLVFALEDEWRWLARTGGVAERTPPDFLARIRTEPLAAAAPEKVTLHTGKGVP